MTESTNIDYRVIDSKIFAHVKKGKQISKIGQKASQFQFISKEDQFQIQIIFKNPAIITMIQVKARRVNQISIDMYNGDQKLCNLQIMYESRQIESGATKICKLEEKSQKFSKAVVRFINYPEPKATCIGHLLFKGFKQQTQKKTTRVKNVADFQNFEPSNKKRVGQQQRKMFNQRNKQKQLKKTTKQDLLKQVTQKKWSKNNQDQDSQLRRAIQLSKKQQNQLNNHHTKSPSKHEQIILQDLNNQNQFFQYDVVQWQKVKKTYQHVTPQWIQAQKKAQKQQQIQKRHSIAQKIKIKIFTKMQFCINNIHDKQKIKLKEIIKQLGGRYIQQPTRQCFIITNRIQGGKVNMAKLMQGIKFIKPQYIYDCNKMQACLQPKQYHP